MKNTRILIMIILVIFLLSTGCKDKNPFVQPTNENEKVSEKNNSQDSLTRDISKASTQKDPLKAEVNAQNDAKKEMEIKNPSGMIIKDRFRAPEGFVRVDAKNNSFEDYLVNLQLEPDGAEVHYFDGKVKNNSGVYDGVIDIDTGERDLQQCADAVMRFRGEYLYKNKRYSEIHFNFLNGQRVDYTKWMEGYRIAIKGDETFWVNAGRASNTYQDFRKYMDVIFAYANTESLIKEMKKVSLEEMIVGDILIDSQHAVIIVDMAVNKTTNQKVFMLAQSYMPAQDIQILQNPKDSKISPWIALDSREKIITPQWVFTPNDLMRFK